MEPQCWMGNKFAMFAFLSGVNMSNTTKGKKTLLLLLLYSSNTHLYSVKRIIPLVREAEYRPTAHLKMLCGVFVSFCEKHLISSLVLLPNHVSIFF